MSSAVRRPLLVIAVATLAVAGWLGLSPLLAAPVVAPGIGPGAPRGPAGSPGASLLALTSPSPRPAATATPRATAMPVATSTAGATPLSPNIPGPTAAPGTAPTIPVPRHAGASSATPAMRAVLDARLEAFRVKHGLPGISAAIIFGDGSVWLGSSGFADVAGGRPMTDDTAMSVASISKTFTAALILALAEEGRLRLEVPAVDYLPGMKLDPKITVRELLDHTSGLADYFYHPRMDAALLGHRERAWTPADALRYVGKPYFKPGADWAYSNTNYLILGMLAEAVGHEPVADQLRRRFLGPLDLDDTFYQAVEAPKGPVAHGYRFEGSKASLPAIDLSDGSDVTPFTSVVTATGAAGSIASSAEDIARWARALYGGSALDPESRQAMLADVFATARFKPSIGYGLGVQAYAVDNHWTLGHSGRLLGTRAVMRWLPNDGLAIAILTNQSRTDPNVLLRLLLPAALGQPSDCATCPVRR